MMDRKGFPAVRRLGNSLRRGTGTGDKASLSLAAVMVIDDATLIEQALSGDPESFGELVKKYQDRLYNTVVRFVGCRDEAEDVVQDAFVQAFVKLDTFQHNSAFYTWLYRIAFNVAVSRSRKKRPGLSIDHARDLTGNDPVDPTESPTEHLEREERAAQVHAGLARLSEEHRTILVLREMEGFCYDTIADIIDVPVGTVRSRLHRARMQLRDELKEVLQVDPSA